MIQFISMLELQKKSEKLGSNELILDVRTPEEYAEGHVPGSKNIPYEQVGEHDLELKKYDQVYIHCRSGKRAQVAAHALEKLGLSNLVCIGDSGMMDWLEAGFKVQK